MWRFARRVAGILAVLSSPFVAAWLLWFLARSEACAELPREDLSLQEMGQLRRALDRYKSDPTIPITLTPRQASFLLREEFKLMAWLTVAGDQVRLEARLPEDDGTCWNVEFRGHVVVEDGVAHLVPSDVSVGRLGLGWVLRGRQLDLRPEQVREPKAAELLSHLTRVRVEDGWFRVEVDDPRWIR